MCRVADMSKCRRQGDRKHLSWPCGEVEMNTSQSPTEDTRIAVLGLDMSPPLRIAWRVAEGRGLKTDHDCAPCSDHRIDRRHQPDRGALRGPGQRAGAARHLTVEPATGLENQVVHVSGAASIPRSMAPTR